MLARQIEICKYIKYDVLALTWVKNSNFFTRDASFVVLKYFSLFRVDAHLFHSTFISSTVLNLLESIFIYNGIF